MWEQWKWWWLTNNAHVYLNPRVTFTSKVEDANTNICPDYWSMDVTSNQLLWAKPPRYAAWYKRIHWML